MPRRNIPVQLTMLFGFLITHLRRRIDTERAEEAIDDFVYFLIVCLEHVLLFASLAGELAYHYWVVSKLVYNRLGGTSCCRNSAC